MTQPGTNPPHARDGLLPRSDPRFARGVETGHRRRRGPAWVLLALSTAMLISGMTLPQGLLLTAGLVTAAIAAHLLISPQDPHHPGLPLQAAAHPGAEATIKAIIRT
ncbi:DUF3040 domain-containing protein [Nonomuraea sp. NPDC005650]|uniref:DUF3040 domain-containing protein n=1 Tax=Nonomuraea sp. NPDC005650 TaxID=3157045 RepID=UPI0033B1AF95